MSITIANIVVLGLVMSKGELMGKVKEQINYDELYADFVIGVAEELKKDDPEYAEHLQDVAERIKDDCARKKHRIENQRNTVS